MPDVNPADTRKYTRRFFTPFRVSLRTGVEPVTDSASIPRVLFADDHVGMHNLVHRVLGPSFEVTDVFDGQQMLDRIPALRPDLLLVDINMPVLGGMEAVERLDRSNRPAILFLTGEMDLELLKRMRTIGAQGCVLKATADEDLLPAIHAALRGESFFSIPRRT